MVSCMSKSKRRNKRKRKGKSKKGGSDFSSNRDSASAVLDDYHKNTENQRALQNEMNNQYGGNKKMRGGGGDDENVADITDGGDHLIAKSQLSMQNTMRQAKHDDSLSHCSDGSCTKKGGKKRRRKSRKNGTKKKLVMRKNKKTKKVRKKKRKLNKYFELMLDAKKKGLKSFKYNGNTYVGKQKKHLGMIYKKK